LLVPVAHAATPTISATAYRARLESARADLDRLQKRPPVDVTPVLKGLAGDVLVKRNDGATQLVQGDEWAQWLAAPKNGTKASKLTGHQARALRDNVTTRLKSFDAWNTPTNGAFYRAADAQKIVRQLEASGQIRTQPLWWQSLIARGKNSVAEAFQNFMKWLGSLFPTRSSSVNTPDAPWLIWVFWGLVIAILGVIIFFVVRAFEGRFGSLSWFGLGRRKKKNADGFEGEDAELLLLPPDELRQRAERFAAQGNFREALRHRFIAMLLLLDQRGVWRYDVRRTNWEHIGALRRETTRLPLVAPLSDLTQRFDRVRYGGADCSPDEWTSFQRDVQSVETQAQSAPAKAVPQAAGVAS
jgi:hypothetical protein